MDKLNRNTQDKLASAYDSPSWWYDIRGYFILRLAYRSKLSPILNFFSKNFGKHHLEAAIGSGTFLSLVLKSRASKKLPMPESIDAFDYAPMMLEGAKKRFNQYSNIKIIQSDVTHLPYQNDLFDTINVANSLHCFSDIDNALQELFRVLKPNGTLAGNVLLFPSGSEMSRSIANKINQWGMRKGILVTPYEQDNIKDKITKIGFIISYNDVSGNMYNFIAKKPDLKGD